MARCIWYSLWQCVLDTTSMAGFTWYYLYGKVYLIQPLWQSVQECTWCNLYDKVYLIQPLCQGVLVPTSMTNCTWYDLCQGALDTTSMARCTRLNLYGKVYSIEPLWQGVLDTTSMAMCTWYNLYGKIFKNILWLSPSISPRNKISVYTPTLLYRGTCALHLIEMHVPSIS
jgi:hypothetical protein